MNVFRFNIILQQVVTAIYPNRPATADTQLLKGIWRFKLFLVLKVKKFLKNLFAMLFVQSGPLSCKFNTALST